MNGQRHFLNVVLATALISVAACNPLGHAPRRQPPRPNRPISLEELEYSCSVQGWSSCHQMASDLLNTTHSIHLGISSCRNHPNNSAYESRHSLNTNSSENATSSENGSGGEGETRNSSFAEPTSAVEELRCLVSGSEKKRIRRDVYCELLFDMDRTVRFVVQFLCFMRDFNCITTYPDPGYLTPEQMITSIRLWHEDMIETHRRCCELEDKTFSRDMDSLYGSFVRIGELASIECPFSSPTIRWDHALTEMSLLVYMLEQMQDLGRRKTCLRGCVSENQVLCTNLLPFLMSYYNAHPQP